ncbi:hypothetical protein BH11PSE4_BH11PSE4_32820 [soil metagenome]
MNDPLTVISKPTILPKAKTCVTWLHLSDWHQGRPDFDRSVLLDRMLEDIGDRDSRDLRLSDIDLVIFSGDVAFSGKAAEYSSAQHELIEPLRRILGEQVQFVFAPGNHDLDRSQIKEIPPDWERVISSRLNGRQKRIGEILYDKKKAPMLLAPFENFYSFSNSNGFRYLDESIVASVTSTREGLSLGVVAINTAFCCARHTVRSDVKGDEADPWDYGVLSISEQQMRDAINRVKKSEIKMLVMHHPISWMHESEQPVLEQLISSNFDLVLYGHEHLPRFSSVSGNFGDIKFIPAGSAFASRTTGDPRYTNAFNFGVVDLKTQEGAIYHRRWIEERDIWQSDDRYWPEGIARFLVQKKMLPENGKYIHDAQRRYKPFHSKRAGKKAEITLKHCGVEIAGENFIQATVRLKTELYAGPSETFEFRTSTNKRIENHKSAAVRDRAFSIVSMSPVPPAPSVRDANDTQKIVGRVTLPAGRATVEYHYEILECEDGIWYFALARFIDYVKIVIERADGYEYEFLPLGGFPDLKPGAEGILSYETLESEGGHLPGQGYLVQWYKKK